MWKKMDENGDGHVQYKEAEESLREFFHSDAILQAKPAIRRAFDFAKDYIKGSSHKKAKHPKHTHLHGTAVHHRPSHSPPTPSSLGHNN